MKTIKITKATLRTLKAPADGKRYEVKDSDLSYLRARVTPSGHCTLSVYKKPQGERTAQRVTLYDATKVESRAQLERDAHAIVDKLNNNAVSRPRDATLTMQEALDSQLAGVTLKETTRQNYRNYLNLYFKKYKDTSLAQVAGTPKEIARHYQRITKEHGQGSAIAGINLLRSMVNFVRADDATMAKALPAWPATELRRYNLKMRSDPRQSVVKQSELAVWADSVHNLPHSMGRYNGDGELHRDLLLLALLTGARSGELFGLRRGHVDMDRGEFTFHDTKNGSDHCLPITEYTRPILERRLSAIPASADARLFDCARSTRGVERVKRETGIHFSPHSLRKTFARVADQTDGVGHYMLKRLINHSSAGDITSGYAGNSITTEDMEKPLAAIQSALVELMGRGVEEAPKLRVVA